MKAQGGSALPDELLEQAGWLRGLARALCRDEQDALDLEQETWLAALRGGAHARDARAWLGSVARRLVASRGRSDGRRDAREQRAASERPPESPDTADTLASVELSARLARAVVELDEPYRSTLALRYYEGLPPRRIAARMGVDVRAVESRLRRGRARLREALDRDCGGREVWFGAALALGLAAGDHGGKVAALVATLLLLVGGGGTAVALHAAPPRVEPEPRVQAVLREPLDLYESRASEPATESDSADPAQESRRAVALPVPGLALVAAGGGEPLAGAVVVWSEAGRRRRVETDAEGCVDFSAGLGGRDLRVDIAATERTLAHRVSVPGDERSRVVVPRRGGRLLGCTQDFDGRAVPFAEVLAWREGVRRFDLDHPDRRTTSDALGQFVLDDLGGEDGTLQSWALAARAQGMATYTAVSGNVDPRRGDAHVYLWLEPAWEVFGRVMDGSGRSLADVPLIAYHSGIPDRERMRALREATPGWNLATFNPRFDLRSGPGGEFSFQVVGLEPGGRDSWRLQANSPNHSMVWVPIEGPGRLDLRLEWGNRLDGVVLDALRRPVEGARVGLIVRDRRTPVVTDASGRFAFEGLSDIAGGVVHVQAKGHALSVQTVDLPLVGGSLEFVLEPACRLHGFALDADGKPLRGKSVTFEGDRTLASPWVPRSRDWRWEDACVLTTLMTEPDGSFEVDGLYPGRYIVLLAENPDMRVQAYAQVDLRAGEAGEDVVLRVGAPMPDALTVSGRVVDDLGRDPELLYVAARRYLDGERDATQGYPVTRVRSDGHFEFRGLRPGEWSFQALAHGRGLLVDAALAERATYGPGRVDLGVLRVADPQ